MGRTIIPLDLAKSYAKDGSSSLGHRKVGEGIENCEGSKCCEDFCAANFLPGNSQINAWPRKETMPAVLDHAFHLGLARNNKCAPQLRIQSAFDPLRNGLNFAWKTWWSFFPWKSFGAPLGRGWVEWGFTFLATWNWKCNWWSKQNLFRMACAGWRWRAQCLLETRQVRLRYLDELIWILRLGKSVLQCISCIYLYWSCILYTRLYKLHIAL